MWTNRILRELDQTRSEIPINLGSLGKIIFDASEYFLEADINLSYELFDVFDDRIPRDHLGNPIRMVGLIEKGGKLFLVATWMEDEGEHGRQYFGIAEIFRPSHQEIVLNSWFPKRLEQFKEDCSKREKIKSLFLENKLDETSIHSQRSNLLKENNLFTFWQEEIKKNEEE